MLENNNVNYFRQVDKTSQELYMKVFYMLMVY